MDRAKRRAVPCLPALDGCGEHAREDLQHRVPFVGLRLPPLPAAHWVTLHHSHREGTDVYEDCGPAGRAEPECIDEVHQVHVWTRGRAVRRSRSVPFSKHSMSRAVPVRLNICGRAVGMSAGVLGRLQGPPLGILAVRPRADVQVHVPRVPAVRAAHLQMEFGLSLVD